MPPMKDCHRKDTFKAQLLNMVSLRASNVVANKMSGYCHQVIIDKVLSGYCHQVIIDNV